MYSYERAKMRVTLVFLLHIQQRVPNYWGFSLYQYHPLPLLNIDQPLRTYVPLCESAETRHLWPPVTALAAAGRRRAATAVIPRARSTAKEYGAGAAAFSDDWHHGVDDDGPSSLFYVESSPPRGMFALYANLEKYLPSSVGMLERDDLIYWDRARVHIICNSIGMEYILCGCRAENSTSKSALHRHHQLTA